MRCGGYESKANGQRGETAMVAALQPNLESTMLHNKLRQGVIEQHVQTVPVVYLVKDGKFVALAM